MHKIKWIRLNPELFDRSMQRRGLDHRAADLISIDEELRRTKTALQELQGQRNLISKEIGAAKMSREEGRAALLTKEISSINRDIPRLEIEAKQLESTLDSIIASLPNTPDEDIPDGGEDNAQLLKTWGEPQLPSFPPLSHFDIGEKIPAFRHRHDHNSTGSGVGLRLTQMDFKVAAQMSGSRFVLLAAELARLERALANYMLDSHVKNFGYTEIAPPSMVINEAMYNVGQLPKFDSESFAIAEKYRLAPTAEVSLTNIVAGQILSYEELPLRLVAHTSCFRSEAGSAGKDTRGMIRLHEFKKVELVSITTAEQAKAEHERMLEAAESILRALQIPYRVMLLAAQDMGFSSHKTYDIEVWLPGAGCYREISSCSNCGTFQAVRMEARYLDRDKSKQYVHSLNGSGVAVGRALVAVLENYQQADGSVEIPEVLWPYMGGTRRIAATAGVCNRSKW